jgi:hypothetical protein
MKKCASLPVISPFNSQSRNSEPKPITYKPKTKIFEISFSKNGRTTKETNFRWIRNSSSWHHILRESRRAVPHQCSIGSNLFANKFLKWQSTNLSTHPKRRLNQWSLRLWSALAKWQNKGKVCNRLSIRFNQKSKIYIAVCSLSRPNQKPYQAKKRLNLRIKSNIYRQSFWRCLNDTENKRKGFLSCKNSMCSQEIRH